MQRTLLRKPAVSKITSLSTRTIARLVELNQFPRPVQVTVGGTIAWYADDIARFIDSRPVVTAELTAAAPRQPRRAKAA